MFSVYANIGDDMSDADDDEWKIDTGRFKRVIEERYRSVREFEIAELPDKLRNKVSSYVQGGARPRASVFAMLCGALGVSPLYLYGLSPAECRRYAVRVVERDFGVDEARMLEQLASMTASERTKVMRVLSAMAPAPIITEPVDVDAEAISRFADETRGSQEAPAKSKRRAARKRSSR